MARIGKYTDSSSDESLSAPPRVKRESDRDETYAAVIVVVLMMVIVAGVLAYG